MGGLDNLSITGEKATAQGARQDRQPVNGQIHPHWCCASFKNDGATEQR